MQCWCAVQVTVLQETVLLSVKMLREQGGAWVYLLVSEQQTTAHLLYTDRGEPGLPGSKNSREQVVLLHKLIYYYRLRYGLWL